MAVDVLLGLQWGDEGKGKVVDFLAKKYDLVARFQGGPNAGHTLEFEGIKHVLHQVPSGIFHDGIKNIVGNGVVLDPVIFMKELDDLDPFNLDFKSHLFISKKAAIIIPTHRLLDAAYEKSKGDKKIGSTLRGIGPTYQDKVARLGLRVGDVISSDFKAKYEKLKKIHTDILEYYEFEYDLVELEEKFFNAVNRLSQLNLTDSEYFVNNVLKEGKSVLAEGAQGSLLDIDFGSYPFVTSSNTTAAGACTGLGVAPKNIGEVYGIFKAYCTRVGSGPFPTELHDETGEELRKAGNEFGATTGRPRRCGWLDLPALKYAVMVNGVTQLFMMKADILSAFETFRVCTHYKLKDGTLTDQMQYDLAPEDFELVYKDFPGWNSDLSSISSFDELPEQLLNYIAYLEEHLEVPVNIVSIGPDRTETIIKTELAVS